MNRRIFHFTVILLVILFMAGCNPFTTNIYSGFDKYKMPDLGDVDDVLSAAHDASFYENLEDDEDAKAEVLETLEDTYNDPDVDDETRQEAALMAVDVHLKTSNTEDTMTNFNDLISDAANGEEVYDEDDGPEILFKSLFGDPPYPEGTPVTDSKRVDYTANVRVQLQAFLYSVEPLEAYGAILKSGAPAPPDTNRGDTSTKALMSGLVRFICYSLDSDNDNSGSGEYVAGIEEGDLDTMAYFLADPDPEASLEDEYNREPEQPEDEDDEIKFYLSDPVTGDDGLYYAANDGLNLKELMD